jgi:hypothetical protein
MGSQWGQAASKALPHTTEFPLTLTTIELTQDQSSFFHTRRWDLGFNTPCDAQAQARYAVEAGFVFVDGRCQRDLVDTRVEARQIDRKDCTAAGCVGHLNHAPQYVRLAVETHGVVSGHFTGGKQRERRDVDISASDG